MEYKPHCIYRLNQRHSLRDRRPSTTACPACWAKETNELKKYTVYCTGLTRAAKAGQKSLVPSYQHDTPNEATKEGPLSFALFESPFTSVSKVRRGHPSLVSLSWAQLYTNKDQTRYMIHIDLICIILQRFDASSLNKKTGYIRVICLLRTCLSQTYLIVVENF